MNTEILDNENIVAVTGSPYCMDVLNDSGVWVKRLGAYGHVYINLPDGGMMDISRSESDVNGIRIRLVNAPFGDRMYTRIDSINAIEAFAGDIE